MDVTTQSPVEIVPAQPEDYEAIRALCLMQGWQSYARADYMQALRSSFAAVARKDGRVVGFARYLTDGVMTCFLCEIVVAPQLRGRGIGKMLTDYVQNAVPTGRIDLISDADGFYEKQGFRFVGRGYRRTFGEMQPAKDQ